MKKDRFIIFNDEITKETISALIERFNEFDIEHPIVLYFTTSGGELYPGKMLIDYLNKSINNGLNLEIVSIGEVSSIGFIILHNVECKKSFVGTFSVYLLELNVMILENLL